MKDLKGSADRGRRRLQEIAEQANKKFGASVAMPLDQARVARVLKLPFGILELDWRTGGGVPMNRITRLWGKPSSLKSTTCLRLVRNAQAFCRHCKRPLVEMVDGPNCNCPDPRWSLMDPLQFGLLDKESMVAIQYGELPPVCGETDEEQTGVKLPGKDGKKVLVEFCQTERCEPFRCLYIDTEGSIDEAWAKANGVDTSLLLLVGGNWAEQVLDLTDDLIMSNEVDLIILDSLDMLTPGETLQKALEQTPQVAAKAGVMTRAMQKWTSAINAGGLMNRYTPTTVIVSQVRAKHIGKPWATIGPSGGWAVEHGVTLDVRLSPDKYEYKGEKALYGQFECFIAQCQVGGFPKSKGIFRFWLRPSKSRPVGDTEDKEMVLDHAVNHGFVEKGKSKWTLKSRFLQGGGKTFKTAKALKAFLEERPTVYTDLRYRVLTHLIGEDVNIELPSQRIAAQAAKKEKLAGAVKGPATKKKKKKAKGGKQEVTAFDDDLLSVVD